MPVTHVRTALCLVLTSGVWWSHAWGAAPHVRVVAGGGIVNGYAYQPQTELPEIGATLRNGFAQAGIGLVRGLVGERINLRLGAELLMLGYKEGIGWDLGPGMIFHARTDAGFKYVGPMLEWELARSDSLGWKIFLSGGCGVAVQSWRVRIKRGRNATHFMNTTVADYRGSGAAFAAGGGISGLRRIAPAWGIAIAAGGLVSGDFAGVSVGPARETYLGLRQVYAIGGLYREF